MPQNSLHDVERHLVLHQPRCQRVPQRVRIDLTDLAAFGNCGQTDLKALGIEMRSGLGREQQPVRVRPCGICQREQMPDQKLAQAVRDRDLAIRRACLRRVLDDKVCFLLRIVIQNLNVWILRRNGCCRNTDQIFRDRIATRCVSRMTSSMKTCISDGLRTRISGVITSGLVVSSVGLHGRWYFLMAYAKKSFSSICWF